MILKRLSRVLQVSILALLMATTPVFAASPRDVAKADAHVEKGKAHFVKGAYDQAIAELVMAIGYDRQPGYLWNIARAYEKKGDLKNARFYYEQYMTLVTDPKRKEEAEAKMMALERLEAERMAKGKLMVTSSILGAKILIDSKEYGVTPMGDFIELTIGVHTVELLKDGFKPAKMMVTVEGAITRTVNLDMIAVKRHTTGELKLTVSAVGAKASVDGTEVGTGPFEQVLTLEAGPHEIAITKDGVAAFVKLITIAEGGHLSLAPNLSTVSAKNPVPGAKANDGGGSSTLGWVLVGVGVAAAGAGAYFLIEPYEVDRKPLGDGREEVTTTTLPGAIMAGVGGAALVSGIIILATGGDDDEDQEDSAMRIRPVIDPIGSTVGFHATF